LIGVAVGWAAIMAFKNPNAASDRANLIHAPVATSLTPNDNAEHRDFKQRLLAERAPDSTPKVSDDVAASHDKVEGSVPAIAVKPEMNSADSSSPAKVLDLPAVVGKAARKPDFVPLFNGKDLTGWNQDEKQRGNWRVVNHILTGGSGPAPSHLYTVRGDYKDFHLRVEARFNKGGRSGLYFRCPVGARLPENNPKWPEGYEATINNARIVRNSTGGIYPGVGNDVFITEFTTVSPERWFTLEVIVDGHAVATLVDGKSSGYHLDKKRLYSSGHIALQQYSPNTVIEFRKIEIKERSEGDQNDSKEIRRIQMGRVSRVAFSADGLDIVSGSFPNEHWRTSGGTHWFSGGAGAVRLLNTATGRTRKMMAGEGWPVTGLAVSSDGRFVASCPSVISHEPILIWDLKSGKHTHRLTIKDRVNKVTCTTLCFSSDGHRVLAGAIGGTVHSWDLDPEHELPTINLKAGPIRQEEFPAAVFTSDRRHLVTGRQNGLLEMWDVDDGNRLQTFSGRAEKVTCVACSVDERRILSGNSDGTVHLWDVASGKELRQMRSENWPVTCVALSPDSARALSADRYGLIQLWDLTNGKEVCRMEGHTMKANSVAFSPDGRRAVSGSDDRTVRLWQLPE
jgi:WD40 repeat protein